uniref:VWFD domain-containing protein n=1 Tax=Serinus canaria TaxID=9135 RepID=A0A8C9NQR2_SERCA
CPPNSHYNPCTSACPATCTDPLASQNCSRPCVEGCECNSGFVLSGEQCVSMSNCGCFQDGKYYEKGESFWQPDCVGQCVCTGNGTVVCNSDTCEVSEVCKVQNGLLGCYPLNPSTCHIFGDPHYITFDGRLYHFQGDCNYTVVERCTNSSEKFSVTTRNEHRGNPNWTALNSVAVNGDQVRLPVDLNHEARISIQRHYIVIDTSLGIQVKFDGDQELFILVDESLKGQLCGLCGTFNDNQLDDFLNPDKVLEQDPNKFGDSWIVKDDNRTLTHKPCLYITISVVPPACDTEKEKEYEELCKIILKTGGPFQFCHSHIPPQQYFESCVYDLCATEGDSDQYCKILEAYAAACEVEGVHLGEWREDTICGKSLGHLKETPHYHTFDNQLHNFMGTCTYTLSKLCESNSSLPYFNVEAANEHRGGNTRVSYVRYVDVDVADQRIRLGQGGVVTVNGVEEILPCSPSAGVQVLSSGFYTMVMTDFGLRVKFDGNHRVEVTLPSTFGQKVCGMCGNYNGIAADDFQNPEGTMEPDSTSLGNSWEVPGDTLGRTCNETDKELISSSHFCGLLTDTSGPFQVCHAVLSPSSYFDTCSYDLCELGLDRETLCKSLQSYADACQSLGVQIPVWRNSTFCPIACPEHSHYEPCAAACPATCVDPMAPVTCSLPCVEGCVCDSGYLLYNDHCVPSQQCGCWHNGQHYPVGSEFWTDNTCSSKCTCPARGGKVQCFNASCPAGQLRGSFSFFTDRASCSASGDPHYNTFDHKVHNFMGNCTYTLSKVCTASESLPYFDVSTTNEHRGANTKVSYVKSVHVEVYAIHLLSQFDVQVNGHRMNLPVFIEKKISIQSSGGYVLLETDFGLWVRYDGNHYAEVSVPSNYSGLLCGLCGNYNGDPNDDNIKPNGDIASDSTDLGESWLVLEHPQCVCCDRKYMVVSLNIPVGCFYSFIYIFLIYTGIFKDCHSKVPPQNFFENCVYDMCFTGGQSTSLCYGLQAYAESCVNAGICIEWRNATLCPMSCPGGSIYKSCGTRCPSTCLNISPVDSCSSLPVEGCFCKEGYVLSGDKCVPESNCGCVDEKNHYHQLNESWFPHNPCTERCTCRANNTIECISWECGVQEECSILDGVLGCHSNGHAICQVVGDPHYFTFDGMKYTFVGTCTYTLVEVVNTATNVIPITILGKNEDRGLRGATYLKEVYIDLYGVRITLQKNQGILVSGGALFSGKKYLKISWLRIAVGKRIFLYVLRNIYAYVHGMCGNFNGNHEDDLSLTNGTAVTAPQFGNSWEQLVSVLSCSCLPDLREDDEPPCTAENKQVIEKQCNVLKSDKFKACHSLVNPDDFIEICIYDMCQYDGMKSALCDIVQAYVDTCKNHGITIKWRNSTFCPLPCPSRSHYKDCVSPCPSTCSDIFASSLCEKTEECTEGCECDDNYVLSNGNCVPLSSCGCRDDDNNYYSVSSLRSKSLTSKLIENWSPAHLSMKERDKDFRIYLLNTFHLIIKSCCLGY